MGLDNGLYLKTKREIDWQKYLGGDPDYPDLEGYPYIEKMDCEKGFHYWEFCYWRKCWGLRNDFLKMVGEFDEEENAYCVSKVQLENLQSALFSYLRRPDSWEDSIWEICDYSKNLGQQIWVIGIVLDLIKRFPGEIEIFFYDSY